MRPGHRAGDLATSGASSGLRRHPHHGSMTWCCSSSTMWDVFGGVHREDIDKPTLTGSDCIDFCVENTTRTTRRLITPDILKEKKRDFGGPEDCTASVEEEDQ